MAAAISGDKGTIHADDGVYAISEADGVYTATVTLRQQQTDWQGSAKSIAGVKDQTGVPTGGSGQCVITVTTATTAENGDTASTKIEWK